MRNYRRRKGPQNPKVKATVKESLLLQKETFTCNLKGTIKNPQLQ